MKKPARSELLAVVLTASAFANFAAATPITVTNAFHLLDNRGVNSIGSATGVRQQFGANAVPNGNNGTTGVATQGVSTVNLDFLPFDVSPNFFSASRAANAVPNGQWTLTFQNGPDTTIATTPSIAGAVVSPFASNMTITPGATPTFNWLVPNTFTPDRVRIQIRDTTQFVGSGGVGGEGVANIIYQQAFAGNTTSFTVNPADPAFTQPLVTNRLYAFELQLLDLRNALGGTGNANILSRSRTFADFSLLPASAPGQVFLPVLVPGPTPVFQFNISGIVAGRPVFIDPLLAIGYDYQIGAGDPNFASVTLPTGIGDDIYDLFLFDTGIGDYVDSGIDLLGGVEHDFGPLGVDRFRILGIETSAGLDPNNVTAFITGLSFVADGQFTGSMTPITVDVVPIPGSLALLGLGLGLLGLSRRRNQ